MHPLRARLAERLQMNGWDVLEHVSDLEWWADESWELTSIWSPTGAQGFVTFLVDPLWEGRRRKGQAVWAVGCSANYPKNRDQACGKGILRLQGSAEEFEMFLQAVNDLRDSERS